MIDGFGRRITYVRLSITDRCDLRCRYCMSEQMTFMPNSDLLTVDEIMRLAGHLTKRGVRRIRLTGGEPLVRRDFGAIVEGLGARLGSGLDELTLTTNGTLLRRHAATIAKAGVQRVNVSLDTLDPERFRHITRRGLLAQVLDGIEAAAAAGLKIKINMVALGGLNDDQIEPMMQWCAQHGHDLTLIETMPLGEVEERRDAHYLPLDAVQRTLDAKYGLAPSAERTGGPARYYQVGGLGLKLGLITPLTNNFCASCNRVRITATGTSYGCLGQSQKVDFRDALRAGDDAAVERLIDHLAFAKPQRHDFDIARSAPAVERHMSVTGG